MTGWRNQLYVAYENYKDSCDRNKRQYNQYGYTMDTLEYQNALAYDHYQLVAINIFQNASWEEQVAMYQTFQFSPMGNKLREYLDQEQLSAIRIMS